MDALAALRPGRAIDLHELMPEDYTDGLYRSTLRAARRLADAGEVVIVSGSWGTAVRRASGPRPDDDRGVETVQDAGAVEGRGWYQRVYAGRRTRP